MSETTEQIPGGGSNAAVTIDSVDDAALIAEAQKRGHHVYTRDFSFDYERDENDPFLGNVKRAVITRRTREVLDDIDEAVKAIPGFVKGGQEKTTDFVKRALNSLASQVQTTPDISKMKGEYETKLTTQQQQAARHIAEITIRGTINQMPLSVAAEQVGPMREMLMGQALNLPFRTEGSQVVFQKTGPDGKTLIDVIDPSTGKAMDADKYLLETFKTFVVPATPATTGSGAQPAPANTAARVPQTKDELTAQIMEMPGMMHGSKEFMRLYREGVTKYALTK